MNQLKRGVEGGFCVQKYKKKTVKRKKFEKKFDTDFFTKRESEENSNFIIQKAANKSDVSEVKCKC